MSLIDLASRLGVCKATLTREISRGRLAGCKVGQQWRFSQQQIADYLQLTRRPLRLYGKHPIDDSP